MGHGHLVSRGLSDRAFRTARIGCDGNSVSYLTSNIAVRFRKGASRRRQPVFGCDICQEVCPWNASPVNTAIRRGHCADLNLAGLIESVAPDRRGAGQFHRGHGNDARRREGPAKKHCGRTRQLQGIAALSTSRILGDGRDVQRSAGAGSRAMGGAQTGGFYRPRMFVMTYSSTVRGGAGSG